MAKTAVRHVLSLSAPRTRPNASRCGRILSQCQRTHATATAVPPAIEADQAPWTTHKVAPVTPDSTARPSRLVDVHTDRRPRPFSSFLTDKHSREHNYLRISVTERCNLRCVYCMPAGGVPLSPQAHLLTTPEIVYLSSVFVDQGVTKIRLTGGEPTVRKDIVDLMRQIGQLRSAGLKELCLTTNGISLHRKLDAMVESGLTGVNLSLDTLDPHQFTIMTRRNGHDAVMKSIHRVLEMNNLGAGVKLKINCVVMRGLNDREIIPFVELGREKDIEVRFIEYMPFDGNKWSKGKMLSFKEMLALIRQKYPDVHRVQDHPNDTSKTYKVPGFVGRIGFITSMTHNFCGSCNRLRITGDGNLKVCLFGNSEVSLRDILRESNNGQPIDTEAMEAIKQLEMDRREAVSGNAGDVGTSERESRLLEVIGMAVKRKKAKHAGMGELENMKNRPMILIDDPPRILQTDWSHISAPSNLHARRITSRTGHAGISSSVPLHLLCPTELGGPYAQPHRHYSSSHRDHGEHPTTKDVAKYKPLSRPSATSANPPIPHLSHLTSTGAAHMISITHKSPTHRTATATAVVHFSNPSTYAALSTSTLQKGDALAVARVAGIQAAKRISELIPLAHPGLGIESVTVELELIPPLQSAPPSASPDGKAVDGTPHPSLPHADTPHTQSCSAFGGVQITSTVSCTAKTGIEMEALTSATITGLTIYDMCKGVDKGMVMGEVRVTRKTGGKSGDWMWDGTRGGVVKDD